MSRKYIDEMDLIFEKLKDSISEEDESRVSDVRRHIKAKGNEEIVKGFVKSARLTELPIESNMGLLYHYKDKSYLLMKDIYVKAVATLGLKNLNENDMDAVEIIQGCEMLAINQGVLSVLEKISSIQIIDECLGLTDTSNKGGVEFAFQTIREFFEPCSVFEIDCSRFDLQYQEDLLRLCGYCLSSVMSDFTDLTYEKLRQLLLLPSSRSISASVINSLRSPLKEYSFLQLYQCLEYMFLLNNAFNLNKKYNIPADDSIKIVIEYEFKVSESDNLKRVIENLAPELKVKEFMDAIGKSKEKNYGHPESCKIISAHIYKIRCHVAHLRYGQRESLNNMDWDKLLEAMANLLFGIYEKNDTKIKQICESNQAWKKFSST